LAQVSVLRTDSAWKLRLLGSLANLDHEILGARLLQQVLSPFEGTDLVTIIHCEQGIDGVSVA
jgi:hypothetical protein